MTQFDIHRFLGPVGEQVQYAVILNHDFTDLGRSSIVAPCYQKDDYGPAISKLTPMIEIEGMECIVALQELGNVSVSMLGKHVGSLTHMQDDIVGALDLLFTGF